MKVLVCGATGCVGRAVVNALRSRGHQVVGASRGSGLRIDFMAPVTPQAWAARLGELQVNAVVNCVGLLMPRGGQRFERVHAQGPIELFRGAALAGVARVVQVSALGAADGDSAYLRSKRQADDTLLALPLAATVLRPSLVYGPHCPSAALFATLAALPVLTLPGAGRQRLQPIHVYELAEIVARCIERPPRVVPAPPESIARRELSTINGIRVSITSDDWTVTRSPQSIVAIALGPSSSAKAPLPPADHS